MFSLSQAWRNLFQQTRGGRVRLALLTGGVGRILCSVAGLVSTPLMIRHLGAERYGLLLGISSTIMWLGLGNFGLAQGLQNALSEEFAHGNEEAQKILISTAVTALSTVVLCISLIWYAVSPFIPWARVLPPTTAAIAGEIAPSVQIVFIGFVGQFLISFIPAVYAARQEVHYGNLSSIMYAVSYLVGTVVGVTLKCGLTGMIVAITAATTLWTWTFAIWYFRRPELRQIAPSISWFRKDALRRLRSSSISFFIIQICGMILFDSEALLLVNLASPASATAYNIASRPFTLSNSLFGFLAQPLWAAYGNAKAHRDLGWIKRTRARISRLYWIFFPILFLVILVTGPTLLRWWVGGGAAAPSRALIALVGLYFGIRMWTDLYSVLVNGLDAMRPQAIGAVFHAILTLTLNIFLIRRYGVFGLPAANFLGYLLVSAWLLPVIAREALERLSKQTGT